MKFKLLFRGAGRNSNNATGEILQVGGLALAANPDVTIYVKLLDEGTLVYRPTIGVLLDESTARLKEPSDFDPDEVWEFPVGAIVTISRKQFESGELWVAIALADLGII